MTVYSHSKLEAYRNCPLSYKFRYIDRIRSDREGIEAFMGKRVHEALEKLYAGLRMCRRMSEEELVRAYHASWDENWHDGVAVVRAEYSPEDYRAVGEKALRGYYRRYEPFDDGVTVWLEKKVDIPLDAEGRYRMTGVVDRLTALDGKIYEIHDYKTSQTLPEQAALDADRQLALYQLAVQDSFADAQEVRLVWHFLVFDKELRSRRNPEDLEELKRSTVELIEEIEAAEDFPPREGVLCDWCDYQRLCPLRKHLVEVEQLPPREFSEDEGVRLVDRYAELSARKRELEGELEELREDIIQYAKQHGLERIRGSGCVLSMSAEERLTFPPKGDDRREELEEELRRMGRWEEVASLDTRRLASAISGGSWAAEEIEALEPYIKREEAYSIRMKRPKEGGG